MRKIAVTILAGLYAAIAATAPAMAEVVTVEVAHADLDLSHAAGQKALEARVEAAIKTACAKPSIRNLKAMQAWESCKADATAQVNAQLEGSAAVASL